MEEVAIADEMKNLAEEIEASYGARAAAVEDLVKETRRTLRDFQRDHKEMAKALKADLTQAESQRLQAESQRLEDFKAMNTAIKESVDAIVKETSRLLSDFRKEQKEMAAALKEMLAKGESARLGDFKKMLAEIQRHQEERVAEVRATLREFRKDQGEAHKAWQNLAKTMARKRAGKAPAAVKAPAAAPVVAPAAAPVVAPAVAPAAAPAEKPMTYREFFAYHRPRLMGTSKERMKKIGAMWGQYKRAHGIE